MFKMKRRSLIWRQRLKRQKNFAMFHLSWNFQRQFVGLNWIDPLVKFTLKYFENVCRLYIIDILREFFLLIII